MSIGKMVHIFLSLAFLALFSGCGSKTFSGDFIDVTSFGAKGDAFTDDTAALQAALDAVNPDGGLVYFPTGSYLVTSGLMLKNKRNVTIKGVGESSIIRQATPNFDVITIMSSLDITVKSLYLSGVAVSAVAGSGFSAVRVVDSPRTMVYGCILEGTNNGVVIVAPGNQNCVVSGNTIRSLAGNTSGNGYGVYTACEGTIISKNIFQEIPRHDVYLSGKSLSYGARFCRVIDNQSYGNRIEAVAIYATAFQRAASDNLIKGNTFFSPVGGRVIGLDQNSTNNIIEANTFYEPTGISIFCEGSTASFTYPDHNRIYGNVIRNSGSLLGSIRVINGSYNNIEANQLLNPGNYGILLDTTGTPEVEPTGNQILNNVVKGASNAGIVSNISATTILNNVSE